MTTEPVPDLRRQGILGRLFSIGLALKFIVGLALLAIAATLWRQDRDLAKVVFVFGTVLLVPLAVCLRGIKR
jgi:O-antigen/teichoic acid export membrane protein